MTILGKLIADTIDSFGYITYVFENLDKDVSYRYKYIMCVRYPNWDAPTLKIGDEGYLHYEEIRAGVDTWFNGIEMVPYKYNTVQFIKFVFKHIDTENSYVI